MLRRVLISTCKRHPARVLRLLNYTAIMIRAYRGILPKIAASAYIDQSAQVIGDVAAGELSISGANVAARGDVTPSRMGDGSDIHVNCVVPREAGRLRLVIGHRVTVWHLAMTPPCTIEDDCQIGIGAIVLNVAKI